VFSKIDLPPSQIHLLSGIFPPEDECARYESLLSCLGSIHLLLFNIGKNSEIGLNHLGSSFASRTRLVSIRECQSIGEEGEGEPRLGLTMGIGNLLEAEEIVGLVVGIERAEAVCHSVEGPITHMVSHIKRDVDSAD
jgi:glucosamine-6-phosphate deaminase